MSTKFGSEYLPIGRRQIARLTDLGNWEERNRYYVSYCLFDDRDSDVSQMIGTMRRRITPSRGCAIGCEYFRKQALGVTAECRQSHINRRYGIGFSHDFTTIKHH